MELHAFDRHGRVANAHQLVAIGPGGYFELCRKRVALQRERVVARRRERVRQAVVNALAVVVDRAGLAVHEAFRANDRPAERLPDALMTEADAEDRDGAGEAVYELDTHAGFVGCARTRRDDDVRGL